MTADKTQPLTLLHPDLRTRKRAVVQPGAIHLARPYLDLASVSS